MCLRDACARCIFERSHTFPRFSHVLPPTPAPSLCIRESFPDDGEDVPVQLSARAAASSSASAASNPTTVLAASLHTLAYATRIADLCATMAQQHGPAVARFMTRHDGGIR